MVEFNLEHLKDLGQNKQVMDTLPYAVVQGAWEGSFTSPATVYTPLNHIVPTGHQLKLLFLRIWTQEASGARFSIVQANPTATGQTGTVEAYRVVGSVPQGARDYPMLEQPGAEVLSKSLIEPIHILEGSITFNVLNTPTPATGSRYGIVWWGVEKNTEPARV